MLILIRDYSTGVDLYQVFEDHEDDEIFEMEVGDKLNLPNEKLSELNIFDQLLIMEIVDNQPNQLIFMVKHLGQVLGENNLN